MFKRTIGFPSYMKEQNLWSEKNHCYFSLPCRALRCVAWRECVKQALTLERQIEKMKFHKNKEQQIRYEMREQIEQIIKEKAVDRTRFHEAAKNQYQKVIDKFYYSFFDYKKYPDIQLKYAWLRFHKRLKETGRVSGISIRDWERYIDNLSSLLSDQPVSAAFWLILDYGWVYEGYLEEIITVLKEADYLMEDFYIVSKKYDRMICHCDDGECLLSFKN